MTYTLHLLVTGFNCKYSLELNFYEICSFKIKKTCSLNYSQAYFLYINQVKNTKYVFLLFSFLPNEYI